MVNLMGKKLFALTTFSVLVLLLSFSVYAGVPPPLLTTVPEQPVWIADGVTQYKVTVEADSLASPDTFWGLDVKLLNPNVPGYTFNLVSINTHPTNDFFAGADTDPYVNLAAWGFGRVVTGGNPPSHVVGTIGEVFFTVSPNSPTVEPVETSFGFDGDITSFYTMVGSDVFQVLPEPQSLAFTVRAPEQCNADLDDGSNTGTPDGGVDVNDLLFFLSQFEAGNLNADLDDGSNTGTPDGGVDVNDLLFFLSHFEQGC